MGHVNRVGSLVQNILNSGGTLEWSYLSTKLKTIGPSIMAKLWNPVGDAHWFLKILVESEI